MLSNVCIFYNTALPEVQERCMTGVQYPDSHPGKRLNITAWYLYYNSGHANGHIWTAKKEQKESGKLVSALKFDVATFVKDIEQAVDDMKHAINKIRGEVQELSSRAGEPLQSKSLANGIKLQLGEITNLLCQQQSKCPCFEE